MRRAPTCGDGGAGLAVSHPHWEGPVGVTIGTGSGCGTAGARLQFGPLQGFCGAGVMGAGISV
jgi:hypothetical protein